jgi:cobalt-zinc-cadmium efflux system protein
MHDHSHNGHSRGHSHAPRDFGTAFAIGTAINLAFVCLEAAFGFIANSTALLADAGHNLSDVLGLVVAWAGHSLAKRPPTERFTYGMRGSSILAALANAIFLLVAVGAIGWEAVRRFAAPEPVLEGYVMAVAAAGVLVNGVTAWLFFSGREHDINIRGAFLHMAADAAISVGVVISAALIMLTGWLWLDPATSLVIMAVIVIGTWGLLRESVNMSLAAVPKAIVLEDVRKALLAIPGVESVHDLHVWPMSTTETALTVHVVVPDDSRHSGVLAEVSHVMHEKFSIDHCTTQIEKAACEQCEQGRTV